MGQPLQHFKTVDPADEWKRGFGWFFRIQGIVVSIIADVGAAVATFIFVHPSVSIVAIVAGAFFVAWLFTVRHFRLQRFYSDQSLHAFFHHSRDEIARILTSDGDDKYRERLDSFHVNTAQRIAGFFRNRVQGKTTCCAIRLAERVNEQNQYSTVARSDRMHESRKENSQPIPADKGIAHALLQYENQGVIIIDDIQKMVDDPRWCGGKSDTLGDVRSLMISPINGWENDAKVMLGILFVSSDVPAALHAGHTLAIKAFSDFLGTVYPDLLEVHGGEFNG
ncbi:MAG: hypothetical protein H6822_21105 [Planctomycetaceae bacterium]|nr:hypothetical protein [Planctomycetales bacterium]MCB9924692.1 hypothetical protein [Planctomycetaceae bacterium]